MSESKDYLSTCFPDRTLGCMGITAMEKLHVSWAYRTRFIAGGTPTTENQG
jgi:hypothetical protein